MLLSISYTMSSLERLNKALVPWHTLVNCKAWIGVIKPRIVVAVADSIYSNLQMMEILSRLGPPSG